ncbi:uncharacterized protein A4U43_C01F19200 [Asparagus officinalis]|uniref:CCHC-type domain-containing protein n=1 Tax=Asparagus officinalis TaxID=4686 RepID=A0A5P1FV38_ASPOF|nr:uncharacterized protein A4U43_C01F19200 [Asparagus officinalis]
MKRGVSIREHVNNFTKLISDIANVDIMVEDEDKAMLLLCSLSEDDFGMFFLTLINGRTTVSYKEVTSALVNYELRKNDGELFERASGDALAVRGRSPNRQRFNHSKSKNRGDHKSVGRNQCAFCKEEGHWKNECPKLKDRVGKQRGKAVQASEVNVAKVIGDTSDLDSSGYSCPTLLSVCYADSTEWMLDSGAIFHIYPKRDWFTNFKELERGDVVLMGNDHVCPISGISSVRIRMLDEVTRELKEEEDATLKVMKGSMVVMRGVRENNLYYLKGKTVTGGLTASITTEEDTTILWHLRLGYTGDKSLQLLAKHELLKGAKTCKMELSEHCILGKKTKVKFGTAIHNTQVRETPQRNRVAERLNRTLLENVQCIMTQSGLARSFWAEALVYASHLVNRLPCTVIEGKTPMEHWYGSVASDYETLWIFGCPAYFHVSNRKLNPRARKAIFVGFRECVKGFKLWDLQDKKMVISRDVTFDETYMMKPRVPTEVEDITAGEG